MRVSACRPGTVEVPDETAFALNLAQPHHGEPRRTTVRLLSSALGSTVSSCPGTHRRPRQMWTCHAVRLMPPPPKKNHGLLGPEAERH